MFQKDAIYKSVTVNASSAKVWEAITNPELMKKWMLDDEIEITTTWEPGSAIVIKGTLHWVYFEDKGTVLKFEPEQTLQYTHLSSLSKLADEKQNYVIYEFKLKTVSDKTLLSVSLHNFPTESIYQHLAFYWSITLNILKHFIETTKFN
ncbi:MAG: SRPBCC domain-containing protein [Bacteroidota bacterium]